MPIYKADLSDGTTVEIESDHEPTDQEILSAVEKSKPSFLGAAARSFGTSVGPTGAGMAAAAPFMGPAMEAAIPTYGASLLLPVGAGLAGAWAWEKAQKPVLKKAFPGLEAQQERDVQEQKIGSALGRIAAVAPFAEFSPLQSAKALAEIPAAMRGAPEAIKDVAGLGLNIGLQEGIVTAQSLASGQGLPSKAEVGEAAIMGGAFGKLRGPLGKLAGEPSTKPERSAVTPEEQKVREEALKQKYESEGRKAEIVPGKLARNENAVAQTLKDGTVQISRPNLHEQLEQHLLAGKSIDEALDSIVSEESIHGATRTLPGGDEMAAEFYRAMTPLEKWIERRRYHGPRYKGETLSDSDYGSEAIRFQLQMATKMTPGEYLFYRENTVMSNKLLTKLEDIVRWIRETLGTKASKRQLEILGKVEENLAADRKGAKDAQRVREDKGQPAQAGQVAQEGQGDSGQNVEQATPGQPKPVGEGVPVPLNQRFPVGAKVKYTPPGALDPKKSESGTVVGHKTDPTTGQIFAEVELKGGRREFVGDVNNIRPAKKAKAPPAAQPVGAQPGQAPVGAAKAGAAPTAPAPAATPIISTTPAEVQNPRLAELRKLWADRPPTAEEAQEHRELTRESRERAIAQAKARRAGETGPAMPLGGERGEETERRIKAIAYSAGDAYTPEEALTVAHNFADWLQDKPPETWDAYLEKFSERIAEKRNAEAANIVATNVTPQDQEVERIRKQLIAEFEATTGGKVIDLPPPPATTWNFLYTGMLRHLGRPATPRQAKGEAAPSQIKTEKLPKNSMGLTVPQNLAKRIYYDFGDYASYWRAIHRQDPTIPEDYVRQAWSEAVNDYLQNASRDQIMDLLKAHGEDLEHGRFRGFMGDVDATEILRPLDRGYLIQDPKEFQKFRDLNVQGDNPTTGQPYTEQEADAKAAEILFREKDEALFRLDRYAAAKGVTPGEAIKMLRQQIHSELADANEFLELHRGGKQKVVSKEGKLAFLEAKRGRTMSLKEAQKAYRQSLDKAMDRRRRAIDYLSERLIKPSRRPDLDPARPKLSLDDIRTVWTLTPEQAADITFLRGQIWQGTGVKGVAPSKLTRGVVLLKNRITKQMDAVSLYLHPTKKEVYVYNPRFLPGDKTQQHIPIKSVLGTWDITKMFLLESPVNKFHQRWKTEEAFMGEIGDNATIKEVLADSVWEMGQKKRDAKAAISALEKLLEGPTKEEEVTGELPKEAGEEGEAKVEGAEAKAATTEAEGMRPSEAGLVEDEQAAPEERAIEMKSGSPETLAEGSGHLQGPGMGVLGLYQTDPQRLVRGPLTTEEAEAISQAISNYEKGTHQIPIIKQAASKKRGVTTWKEYGRRIQKAITSPLDLLNVLKQVQFRRTHIGWYTGKPKGLRGEDYCFVTGMDKIVTWWQNQLKKQNRKYIRSLPQKEQKAYLEGLNQEALMEALNHVYELKESAHTGVQGPTEQGVPLESANFRTRALEVYGENTGRLARELALAKKRAAQGPSPGVVGERERYLLTHKPVEDWLKQWGIYSEYPGRKGPKFPPRITRPEAESRMVELRGKGIPPTAEQRGGGVPAYRRLGPTPPPGGAESIPPQLLDPGSQRYVKEHAAGVAPPRWGTQIYAQLANRGPETLGRPPREAPPGYQHPPREETGPAMRLGMGGYGPSNRARGELEQGHRALAITEIRKSMGDQELAVMGRKSWKGWDDALRMMNMAEEGVVVNPLEAAAIGRHAWQLLDENADNIAIDTGFGSDQTKMAQEQSKAWGTRYSNTFKTTWSETGKVFQGDLDDMGNYTSIRRQVEEEDEGDITVEDDQHIRDMVDGVKVARKEREKAVSALSKAAAPTATDKGNAAAINEALRQARENREAAEDYLSVIEGMPMMAKQSKDLPPLDHKTEDALANVGYEIMMDLSNKGDLTDERWLEEMRKVKAIGNKYDNYLGKIRAISQEIRDIFLDNFIASGESTKEAREILTRKRPTIEESKAAIARAVKADPKGYHPRPIEAYHVFNVVKQVFLDPKDKVIKDPLELWFRASQETGLPMDRLLAALSTNRTLKHLTADALEKMRIENRVVQDAKNWLKNRRYPGWLQFIRRIPRYFFMDKIFGHGMVPLVTHAGNMAFNPYAWKTYFPVWLDMYKMTFGAKGLSGRDYHAAVMMDLQNKPRFDFWVNICDLKCDPRQITDDYQIEMLKKWFEKKKLGGLIGGRGFDVLKLLRHNRAEQWWDTLPEHMKTGESGKIMGKYIADSVNHATGIVKTHFHEALNWAMFAPNLEASRWAMATDLVKALDIIRPGKNASPEQILWAKSEIRQKAAMVGMYYSMLAMNQGFLKAIGSDEDVNLTDPRKPDFMWFKVPGFKVGVVNPLIGIVKLFANAFHSGQGDLSQMEKLQGRQNLMDTTIGRYARGKFSPFASFAYDVATQQDFSRRPLPWSSDQVPTYLRRRGVEPWGMGEWVGQQISPIPLEEALDTWRQIGMDTATARKLAISLAVFGLSAGTGVRLAPTEP